MTRSLSPQTTQAAQVYFPIEDYFEIKQIAQEEGVPLAAWIRKLALKEVKKHASKKSKFSDLPTFKWKGPQKNLSEHIDQVLYDSP
jgi:hypothetical protein